MERNPKKTKAFIITFIAVFILLILAYFLFFKGGGETFTKSLTGIQKSFSPLLGNSKTKDLNIGNQNGDGTNNINTGGDTSGGTNSMGGNGSGGNGTSGTGSNIDIGGGLPAGSGSGTGGNTGTNNIVDFYAPQCSDGIDNDKDGTIDNLDNDCHINGDLKLDYDKDGYSEFSSTNKKLSTDYIPACSDEIDNDKDGKKDINDQDCHIDNDITKAYTPDGYSEGGPIVPQCSDGIDNDKDGKIDTLDKDCHIGNIITNAYDKNGYSEASVIIGNGGGDGGSGFKPQCSDGVDNDKDGFTDDKDSECHTDLDATNQWQSDANPGSYDPDGYSELTPQCRDGKDNDKNGKVDANDPGCWKDYKKASTYDKDGQLEIGYTEDGSGGGSGGGDGLDKITQCNDNKDNDGNGVADVNDSGCWKDSNDASTYDATDTFEYDPGNNPYVDACTLSLMKAQLALNQATIDKLEAAAILAYDASFTITIGTGGGTGGSPILPTTGGTTGAPILPTTGGTTGGATGPISATGGGTTTTGGKVKPGLTSGGTGGATSGGLGGITTVKIPHLPYTRVAIAVKTKNGTLQIPVILLGVMPGQNVPTSKEQINAYINQMGFNIQAVDSTGNACNPKYVGTPQCSDGKDNDNNTRKDSEDASCHTDKNLNHNGLNGTVDTYDKNIPIEMNFNVILPPNFVPACSDNKDNDGDGLKDENDPGCHFDLNPYATMSYTPDKTNELNFIPQCRDGKDNDMDNLKDEEDPGCHTDLNPNNNGQDADHPNTYDPDKYSEFNYIPQCSDGKDNDADKLIDKNDPGCHTDGKVKYVIIPGTPGGNAGREVDLTTYDPNKSTESNFLPECSDGKDNDGKNGKDEEDLGCYDDKIDPSTYNIEDNFEHEYVDENPSFVPQCRDGKDNDKDGFIDKADPSCHTDGKVTNDASYTKDSNSEFTLNNNEDKNDNENISGSCVNVPLTFTDAEKKQLDSLTRQFNLISASLKTEADVITEKDKKAQYEDLVNISNRLTTQCFQEKMAKPNIPREMLPNPYSEDPRIIWGTLVSHITKFESWAPAVRELFMPAYSYINENDEVNKADFGWDHWTNTDSYWFSSTQAWLQKNHFLYYIHTANSTVPTAQGGSLDTHLISKCTTTGYPGFVKTTSDLECANQPIFGLYDMKNIIDARWKDYKNNGGFRSDMYSAYYLKTSDIIGNGMTYAIPSKTKAFSGDYDPTQTGIWGIVNMYAGDNYRITAQNNNESIGVNFCNWEPDTTNGGNIKANEGDNIILHDDPHNRNKMVCSLFEDLLLNFSKIDKTDIRDLKRTVDDMVYKVKFSADETRYWAESRPLLNFEKTYIIW